MENLVILDRDGVINLDSANYIKHPDEWHALPDSLAAIAALKQTGYTVAVATNQSGIGRGLYDEAMLARIHHKMQSQLQCEHGIQIDLIAYCPHAPDAHCSCRKPKPGLLWQIAESLQIASLKGVPFVGDAYRDLQAAWAANCQAVLVATGKGQQTATDHPELFVNGTSLPAPPVRREQTLPPCLHFANLKQFVTTWLAR